jgi:hypothetical protein
VGGPAAWGEGCAQLWQVDARLWEVCVRAEQVHSARTLPHAPGISPLLEDLKLACPVSEFEFEAEAGGDGDGEGGVSAT